MTNQRPTDTPAVSTHGLTKRYGSTVAVNELDLTVEQGEIFGLLGPNGAGKTTTILMLLGLSEPTAGTASVVGLDPTRQALAVKRAVGYLPDDVGFYDDLTGRQNLEYTTRLNRLDTDRARRRIDQVLDEVDLVPAAHQPVGSYSRGMRQRLGIADALVKEPSLLILDEPTFNIDPEGVRHLLDLAKRLRDDHHVTIVLSSHLLGQVQQVCDRIGIFIKGRLVAVGTLDELAATSVEIEVAASDPTADLSSLLAETGPIETVAALDDERWLITATSDCRDAIATAVSDAGLNVRHLTVRQADLATIYRRYSTDEEPPR